MPPSPLRPPQEPPTDGVIALRLRRAEDVPAIAAASRDAETMRRLDDEPLTPERASGSLARSAARALLDARAAARLRDVLPPAGRSRAGRRRRL